MFWVFERNKVVNYCNLFWEFSPDKKGRREEVEERIYKSGWRLFTLRFLEGEIGDWQLEVR